ncbi:MAG: PKD domain-containing protein [Solirubrobacterales bacterium]
MSGRAARLALAAAALALLCATGASAAPVPLAPVDLSAGGQDAAGPQVAVDPAGDAVAVWSRFNGATQVIQAASRPAGGTWSGAADLSGAGGDATEPQLGIDGSGNAVAVWTRVNGLRTVIQAATMAAGGGWSAPVDLSNAEGNATAPQVAVDAGGDAVVVWSRFNGFNQIVQAAAKPAGGGWSGAVDVSAAGGDAIEPQVGIDGSGNAVAVWSRNSGSAFIVQASTRAGGGGWTGATDLSTVGGSAGEPQVAIGASGEAVAVWSRNDGANLIVQSAARAAGGGWSGAVDLSAVGRNSKEPQVSLTPGGEAVAVWTREAAGFNTLAQAALRPPGGGWSGPADLSSGGSIAAAPQVAVDRAGDAIVVWSDSAASPSLILSATRPAGGGWEGRRQLSGQGENSVEAQIALDPDGDGVGIWTRESGSHPIVQAIGFDGTAPQLRTVSIPAVATIGKPVSFSVSPFDVWSPIASIRWSFGDEATATGLAVSTTYARPGTYRASVVAADAVGRSTEASATVTVYPQARAGRNVLVKGRRAQLRIHCTSPAGCEGVPKLIAAVEIKRGKTVRQKRLPIGTKAFAIPGSTSVNLSIKLTKPGLAAVRGAGKRGLKAQLTGPGIKHRLVALFAARR